MAFFKKRRDFLHDIPPDLKFNRHIRVLVRVIDPGTYNEFDLVGIQKEIYNPGCRILPDWLTRVTGLKKLRGLPERDDAFCYQFRAIHAAGRRNVRVTVFQGYLDLPSQFT